jgi:hypothetical protein
MPLLRRCRAIRGTKIRCNSVTFLCPFLKTNFRCDKTKNNYSSKTVVTFQQQSLLFTIQILISFCFSPSRYVKHNVFLLLERSRRGDDLISSQVMYVDRFIMALNINCERLCCGKFINFLRVLDEST